MCLHDVIAIDVAGYFVYRLAGGIRQNAVEGFPHPAGSLSRRYRYPPPARRGRSYAAGESEFENAAAYTFALGSSRQNTAPIEAAWPTQ